MKPDPLSPTKYAGLRIGKTRAVKGQTDFGMKYEGQYFHYVDKWLFALLRLGQESNNYSRVHQAACWAKVLFPHFFDSVNGGIRWKLNIDSTPIQYNTTSSPNDDTLNAFIIFSLIEQASKEFSERGPESPLEVVHLTEEINSLRRALKGYRPRVSADPLGWGLECWMDQWITPNREHQLRKISGMALNVAHLSLPFRLYGAMLGAPLLGIDVQQLRDISLEYEARARASGNEEHSGINHVMLASALISPGAPFLRKESEPIFRLE